jgi:hypothetical protein
MLGVRRWGGTIMLRVSWVGFVFYLFVLGTDWLIDPLDTHPTHPYGTHSIYSSPTYTPTLPHNVRRRVLLPPPPNPPPPAHLPLKTP